MRRIGALLMLAALAACGNGASPVATITSPTTTEVRSPTTTAAAEPTTTATGAPATTVPSGTTSPPTTVGSTTTGLTVFFLSNQGGNEARQGPFLIPVHRTVAETPGRGAGRHRGTARRPRT